MAGQELAAFGQVIRRVREERGMSTDKLAAVAGVEREQLDELEAGRLDPTYDMMLALAKGLGVGLSVLTDRAAVPVSTVKVPSAFIDVLRETVLRERRNGREVILAALREAQTHEWQRMREGAKGAERRAVWWNLKRIGAFLASVGADDKPAPEARSLTSKEFEHHFGRLPTDGEG
jgi:transcriptional regulator with XRE-family HTH domain